MPGVMRLDVRVLRKHFAGQAQPVLGLIAFSAQPGECLALLAPSGTGKTTLLRIVLGLDRAFDGAVQSSARCTAVVFQDPRLVPWLSVRENIRLVAPDAPEADIRGYLRQLEVEDCAGLRPAEISLGMARRVAIARALAVCPDLLILDEPFASLDPQLTARVAGVVTRHARRLGSTVLLATHDVEQVLTTADRVLILEGCPAGLAADIDVQNQGPSMLPALRRQFAFLSAEAVAP